MAKGILKVTKESNTTVEFNNIDTKLIKRLETGNSAYNDGYYIKHQDGQKYIVSKPDGNEKNNLG